MEDVSFHNKPNDCWLMIKDKVHGDHDPLSNHLQFSIAYSSSSAHPHGVNRFKLHPNDVVVS